MMVVDATLISIKVVLIAVITTFILTLIAVWGIGLNKHKSIRSLDFIFLLPLFIPPSAIGYLILIILGKNGWIGRFLNQNFNLSIIFTLSAAVIAGIMVSIPIMYQSIKSAITSVDEDIINAARVFGASEWVIWLKIILPLSINGILNGILLSFARAFGEFGATILVAGNIPGKTQTLPMAMYYAIENNNTEMATQILLIILIVAIFLMSLYKTLMMRLSH
ncbi:molybdate ABC transporter permease subunit [Turicibacter sanguinis]|uniref:Molybdenum transport system permease n=2 Tax=Turicibacter sanguinis TaxID=154288 RepID=A0A9X5ANQ5_9FIRM|nr:MULTISPECIES: molybdate ABC transporter permease subunit [Turicibacter]EFF62695.1 molybdate ABC transporter, permease protein [Turicibacter sanguinis PC909]MBP3902859.1 molybdate ABC transporter permease subunit [Turicibacter sp.]MCU7191356.1 molybdate ABC transporter permease subunit [Turicibacter sanguinis]MCU7212199.1 molybdate ABC transporter permease subunit [Turicibacter sanguinis]MDB8438475.1 molybdate ABC transporter permease subunit [Turicibacter sanguinis]